MLYSVFYRFGQAKYVYGVSILILSQFLPLPKLPQNLTYSMKIVRNDPKIVISINRLRVNVTNILWAAFSYESFAGSFLHLYFRFIGFGRKNIGAKAERKMLVKLSLDLS
jgi:hypothetical protein